MIESGKNESEQIEKRLEQIEKKLDLFEKKLNKMVELEDANSEQSIKIQELNELIEKMKQIINIDKDINFKDLILAQSKLMDQIWDNNEDEIWNKDWE